MTNLLPLALVTANPNIVSINLVKELLEKGCRVIVLTNHKERFRELIPSNSNLGFADFRERISETPNYLFLIEGFSSEFFSKQQIKEVLNFSQTTTPKTQVILPYVINSKNKLTVQYASNMAHKVKNRNLQIIYLGQVYGIEMDFDESFLGSAFKSISQNQPVSLPSFDIDVYLIGAKEAVKALIKGIFSYGFEKKEVTLAYKTTAFTFARTLQQMLPNLIFVYDTHLRQTATISNFDFVNFEHDPQSLKETLNVLAHKFDNFKQINLEKKKYKFNFKFSKKIVVGGLLFLWILALPFFLLFISSITLKTGFYYLGKLDFNKSSFYFDLSHDLTIIPRFSFRFLGTASDTAVIIDNFSGVGKKTALLLKDGEKLVEAGEFEKLYLTVDDLYKETSLLSGDIENSNFAKAFLPGDVDVQNLQKYLSNARVLVKGLPEILGENRKTKYAVVLQDKSELRPTGGIITSVGIYTFENGHFVSNTFYDVKDLDSLLRGNVVPPLVLKKYLGNNNFVLKDANWDPDFSVTASKIEWFLEKETGESVDGVVAMDSETFNNLKTPEQILISLNNKETQVFLNDYNQEMALSNLNWDGGINLPTCNLSNCQVLWAQVVEANLGLNKVNSYVTRTENLITSLVGNEISYTLEINFNNTSTTDYYRNYVRVLASLNSNFDKVVVNNGGVVQELSPDILTTNGHMEAGVLVQIPGKQSANITFSWREKFQVNLQKSGEFLFNFRKQPEVTASLSVRFIYPASLTKLNLARYNTTLNSDFQTTIKW